MTSPPFSAPTLFELVMLVAWACLDDTPFNQKNPLFARFFKHQDDIEQLAQQLPLCFCAGLFDILTSGSTPPIRFFRSLPLGPDLCWGIYAVLLEKPGSRPRLYIGSGTASGTPTACGVRLRLKQYDDGFLIPVHVQSALDDGYSITNKGLLCWAIRPAAALQPVTRLLFVLLESNFTYMFWAMKARRGDCGMGHLCFWNRSELEYDGVCTHPALSEGVHGEFSMSPEELEAYAREKEEKRLMLKRENNSSWHYKKMAENYADYIDQAHERVKRSRANNPGRNAANQMKHIEAARAEGRYRCELCDLVFGTKQSLDNHLMTPKHLRKSKEHLNPFRCVPCNLGYHNKSNLTRHEKTQRHRDNLKVFLEKQKLSPKEEKFPLEREDKSSIKFYFNKAQISSNEKLTPPAYNPETTSTDFDMADKLYFEELSYERVMDIYDLEGAKGVVVSVGGQLPQNIALRLQEAGGAKVLGTDPRNIDKAEDRQKFSEILDSIGVDQPAWKELTSVEAAEKFAEEVGYPVLVRPSYVLSGAAMTVIRSKDELKDKLEAAASVSPDHPVVISKFIEGAMEIDVDGVASEGKLIVHAVSEHVEQAGVHSGDATLVLPPVNLDETTMERVKEIAQKIAGALEITGPFNMQIIKADDPEGGLPLLKVIECNLRASRSFPFVSKVLGTNFIDIATKALVGKDVPDPTDLMGVKRDYLATKVPQFSWTRLAGADPFLGVEMASTGEMACFGKDLVEAYWTSLQSAMNFRVPEPGEGLLFGGQLSKNWLATVVDHLAPLGYKLYAADQEVKQYLESTCKHKINVEVIEFPKEDKRALREVFKKYDIRGVFNLAQARGKTVMDVDYVMRRNAVDFGVPLFMEPQTAMLFAQCMAEKLPRREGIPSEVRRWSDFLGGKPL
ncbi:hypothetical protein VTI74DRAFT_1185 [Chaetomium olivicolor]